MVQFSKQISERKRFQNFVTIAILFAGVLVGIATYKDFYEKYEVVLELLNKIIFGIFIIEIVVKIIAQGKKALVIFYRWLESF